MTIDIPPTLLGPLFIEPITLGESTFISHPDGITYRLNGTNIHTEARLYGADAGRVLRTQDHYGSVAHAESEYRRLITESMLRYCNSPS